MRKLIVSLTLVSIVLLTAGCSVTSVSSSIAKGSGKMATRAYAVQDFTSLDIGNAFQVQVTQGDAFKVTVTADENLLDYVRVVQSEGELRIYVDSNTLSSYTFTRQEATITMPALTAVRLSGASRVNLTGFAPSATFAAELTGASRLNGNVQATEIHLQAAGASQVDLTGSSTTLSLTGEGASQALLGRLTVEKANVVMRGASRATINAQAHLDYDLAGASHLHYNRTPAIGFQKAEGGSKVTRQ